MKKYSIWIEAEAWAEGEWNIHDGNTDVFVTFDDGARWVASFFTYRNILSLAEKNKQTGECLSGKYLWATDMILVDEVSRERIEEVIADLIKENDFEKVFDFCKEVEDEVVNDMDK
jgi:hypothetical protein